MKKNTNITTLIILLIVEAVILSAFFLLSINKTDVAVMSLVCMMSAALIFFGGIIFTNNLSPKHDNLFVKSGLVSALGLYFLFNLVFDTVIWFANIKFNSFLFIEILCLSLLAITILVILLSGARITMRDQISREKLENGDYDKPKRGGF